MEPAAGRTFVAGDEPLGAPRVAILSDGLWRERFGARTEAIGQTVRFNDEPHTIVGVMPPGIDDPDKAKLWVAPHWRVPDDPLAPAVDPASQRTHAYFSVLARLRPGRTIGGAQSEMDTVAAGLERDYPNEIMNMATVFASRAWESWSGSVSR